MGHEGHEHDDEHGHHGHHGHSHGHGHPHPPAHAHGGSGVVAAHHRDAPATVSVFLVTCSDTRTHADDESGQALGQALEGAGHTVVGRKIIQDERQAIEAALGDALAAGARAVVFNGGTGLGRRDVTVDVLEGLFEKHLPGFGELFRALSFREIGSAAMLSRATAGTYRGALLFAVPGSPQAVKLAVRELILPELGHAVRELTR